MFEKSNTQVVIQGKILTMAGYEKEEYLQSIASYLNKKDQELKEQTKGKRITSDLYSIYLQINIADELMKAREQIAQLEDDVKKKDEEPSVVAPMCSLVSKLCHPTLYPLILSTT